MSGHSDSTTCPNCNCQANRYTDHKPFDLVNVFCNECGFYTNTEVGYVDLVELNHQRIEAGLEELSELPKRIFKL